MRLLTAPEELNLGLDVERWMVLKETRASGCRSETGSDPDTPDMAAALMMTTFGALNLLRTVGAESGMDMPPDAPASVLLSSLKVRKLLDVPLSDAMRKTDCGRDWRHQSMIVGRRVAVLAKASAVIPTATFRLAENELRPRLYDDALDTYELAKSNRS